MARQHKHTNIEHHFTYFKLLDALKTEFCPICFILNKSSWDYFDAFLYEGVNDPQLRERIRKAKGYCQSHAWQLSQCGDALGATIIYHDLIQQLAKEINLLAQRKAWKKNNFPANVIKGYRKIKGNGMNSNECPVCKHLVDVEQSYLNLLIKHLTEPEFTAAYRNSNGLCYPHFTLALTLEPDKHAFDILGEKEISILTTLQTELAEFIRKHDYRYTKEQFTEGERTAWLRTINHFVGMSWKEFQVHPRMKEKAEQLQLTIEQLSRIIERQKKELARLKSIESKTDSLPGQITQQDKNHSDER
ncbi:MAG: DUF6062 family protein [bacterium]|nr:DUF6062 family protein [bacterium]